MGFGSSRATLDIEKLHLLEVQKNKSICRLRIYGDNIGYGFLCKTPVTNTQILVADNNILNSEKLENTKTLELLLNNDDNKDLFINMDKERIKYDSKINELFILEIKEDDELKNTDFIEIEDVNDINKYTKKDIYILPYELVDKKEFPVGKIKDVKEKGKEKIIMHNCNNLKRNQLASFFPILNLETYKMIGINKDDKTGFFIKEDIDAFNEKVEERMRQDITKINKDEVKDSKNGEENKNNDRDINTSDGDNKFISKPSSEKIENEIDKEVNENRKKLELDKNNNKS